MWESTQKARRSHFCHFCFGRIEVGENYRREVIPIKNRLLVHREHDNPVCEPPEENEERICAPLHMHTGVAIAFEARTTIAMQLLVDGTAVPVAQTEFVMVTINESVLDSTDEDIPF